MIDAISYDYIIKSIKSEQRHYSGRRVFYDSIDPLSRKAMAEINSKIKRHSLVGILFCNPNTSFCKTEILSSLNYFHHRSVQYINFFCCGYGAYWSEDTYVDFHPVAKIDNMEWFYSDKALVGVIEDFESRTKWKYSGENELLILDVSPSDKPDDITINDALVCNLEKMQKDKAFSSVRAFFEDLIRYARSDELADIWKYSDKQGQKIGKNFLKDTRIGFLPKKLQVPYHQAKHYAIREISNNLS